MAKKSYFNKENEYLINWKSVNLLNKYVTRFWDIKPRKFTWNSVSQQKKLRKALIRARELWVIKYIK